MRKTLLIITFFFCCTVAAKAQQTSIDTAKTDTSKAEIFQAVQKQPEFPGGIRELFNYIEENRDKKIKAKGRVLLSFVVEKDGSLSDIKVAKGLSSAADAEAIRLMKNSPVWSPGMIGDQPCRVQFNVPVAFSK